MGHKSGISAWLRMEPRAEIVGPGSFLAIRSQLHHGALRSLKQRDFCDSHLHGSTQGQQSHASAQMWHLIVQKVCMKVEL